MWLELLLRALQDYPHAESNLQALQCSVLESRNKLRSLLVLFQSQLFRVCYSCGAECLSMP